MLDKGRITLSAELEEKMIRITVADNGAGMTRERIARVMGDGPEETGDEQEDEGAGTKDSSGIGLKNVRNRLRLYYDRDDLFSLFSEGPGLGTEVTVLLPLREELICTEY